MNGPALRMIRQLLGLNSAQLAREIGRTPGYLSQVETGHFRTVSPAVFVALCERLHIDDRRVLLAHMWTEGDEQSGEVDQPGEPDGPDDLDDPEQPDDADDAGETTVNDGEAAHAG